MELGTTSAVNQAASSSTPNEQSTFQKPVATQGTNGASNDTRTLVTVLLLIFVYPIGVILAWFWSKWKAWIKILVTLPFVLVSLARILLLSWGVGSVIFDFGKSAEFALCNETCSDRADPKPCIVGCIEDVRLGRSPAVTPSPVVELQSCPDAWVDNQQPGDDANNLRQYFIVDGVRHELDEFDLEWVQENCNLEKQVVW